MIKKIVYSSKVKKFTKFLSTIIFLVNDFIMIVVAIFSNFYKYRRIYKKNLRFITGADSSHFKSLMQLCNSISTILPESNIVVYDLGLNSNEIHKLNANKTISKIIKFNYSEYPSFVNIKSKNFGSYAWKPLIIENELSNEKKDLILWMDAGNLVTNKLTLLKIYLTFKGFYSPHSSDNIYKRTHPTTLSLLSVPKKLFKKRNLNDAVIGVDPSNKLAKDLISNWIEASKNKEIIGPTGSSKNNHRFDQALLTIKFYQSNFASFFCRSYKFFGIRIHQDID